MAELIIRIKALLNKISVRKEESSHFTLGQYTFDSITQTLQYRGGLSRSRAAKDQLQHLFCPLSLPGIPGDLFFSRF